MKVRFDRGALSDLSEILDYIEARNPKAATELAERFDQVTKLIGMMPFMGAKTARANFRMLVVGNYLVVYEVIGGEVVIRYVRHAARERPWDKE